MKKKSKRKRHFYQTGIIFLFLAAGFYGALKMGWGPFALKNDAPTAMAPVRPLTAKTTFQDLEIFPFTNDASLAAWERKIFKGVTEYQVREEGGRVYLSSDSKDSASGLYMKTNHEPSPDLYLSWRWRVREFPKKRSPETFSDRADDDFAARLYVIFLASNLFRSDALEYIWDEHLPAGTHADSPYSDRIKLLVLQSGPSGESSGGWRQEERNPLADYEKLFGKKPKHPIGIIALMSDSDSTQSQASADFSDISIKKKIL